MGKDGCDINLEIKASSSCMAKCIWAFSDVRRHQPRPGKTAAERENCPFFCEIVNQAPNFVFLILLFTHYLPGRCSFHKYQQIIIQGEMFQTWMIDPPASGNLVEETKFSLTSTGNMFCPDVTCVSERPQHVEVQPLWLGHVLSLITRP